jgi:hypothetical protein
MQSTIVWYTASFRSPSATHSSLFSLFACFFPLRLWEESGLISSIDVSDTMAYEPIVNFYRAHYTFCLRCCYSSYTFPYNYSALIPMWDPRGWYCRRCETEVGGRWSTFFLEKKHKNGRVGSLWSYVQSLNIDNNVTFINEWKWLLEI